MKPEPSFSDMKQSDSDAINLVPSTSNIPAAGAPVATTQTPQAPNIAPTKPKRRVSWFRAFSAPLILILLIAAGGTFLLKHDEILDWSKTRNYHPTSSVQKIVSDTSMTGYAKRLFYANQPAIEERSSFNHHCTDSSEQSVVLGCYRGNRLGIYIYNVTDPRLAGIQQVTGAHEMLHQAYDRLSIKEQNRINGLLEAYAATVTDKNITDKIELYRKTEPKDLDNELHSIFGTEASNLPTELETYYSQYFTDRKKVLALSATYQSAFNERNEQIAGYDKRLADLKVQIDIQKQNLDDKENSLRAQQTQMETLLDSGNVATYNAQVPAFNAKVASYKADIQKVNALIQEYNQTVDARNKIAVEEQELIRAQDSHASSVNKQ